MTPPFRFDCAAGLGAAWQDVAWHGWAWLGMAGRGLALLKGESKMVRALKGKHPSQVEARKPKCIVFGEPNTGKTWESMNFPNVYYIDVESGATQPHYIKKLRDAGGIYFGRDDGAQDFQTVIEEIKTLATIEHDRLTLVIDSFSKLYNIAAATAEAKGGSDFGRDKKEANKPTRQLMMWLERIDMNVILICHAKQGWKREGTQLISLGNTFDGWEKQEYDLDLSLEIQKQGKYPSLAVVKKTRIEGFPSFSAFPWTYKEFALRAGEATMLHKPKVFATASVESVATVRRLVNLLKLEGSDWVERVFAKAGVTDWSEMDEDKVGKVIEKLNADINGLGNGKAE